MIRRKTKSRVPEEVTKSLLNERSITKGLHTLSIPGILRQEWVNPLSSVTYMKGRRKNGHPLRLSVGHQNSLQSRLIRRQRMSTLQSVGGNLPEKEGRTDKRDEEVGDEGPQWRVYWIDLDSGTRSETKPCFLRRNLVFLWFDFECNCLNFSFLYAIIVV